MRGIAQEAVHERNQDAQHHQFQRSGVSREQKAEYGRAHCGSNDLPLAFVPFCDCAPEQGPNGKGEGDEKRDLSTSRRIMILRIHECWQPVTETIESYRLEEMEDRQHHGAPAVWRTKYLGNTCLSRTLQRRRHWCRQRVAQVLLCMSLKNRGNTFRPPQQAVPGKPAGRLRDGTAEYPNHEGARSANQREPSPPLNLQGSVRHQLPSQKSEHRNVCLDDREREGKRSSPQIAWNYLRRIGVECNQLSPDRNRIDYAHCIDSDGRVLHSHQGCRRSVAQGRASEGRATAPAIGDSPQHDRSQKQAKEGNAGKCCLVGQMEKAVRTCMEDAAANETWADEGRHEEFIELEKAAQRHQRDQLP